MEQLPSVLLGIWAVAGLWALGQKRRWGWLWVMGTECGWGTIALVLHQYGLVLACIIYIGVYARNWALWGRA